MGGVSVQTQFGYMKNMRHLFEEGTKNDSLARIDNFFLKTGMTSQFIYNWIKNTYQKKGNAPVHGKFAEVEREFTNQLDRDICKLGVYLLIQDVSVKRELFWTSKAGEVEDKWLNGIAKKSESADQLLEASLHLGDILFTCTTVLSRIPEKMKEFSEGELTSFIECSLDTYLSLLPESEEAKQNIKKYFVGLCDAFSKDSSEEATHLLSMLKQSLKTV